MKFHWRRRGAPRRLDLSFIICWLELVGFEILRRGQIPNLPGLTKELASSQMLVITVQDQ